MVIKWSVAFGGSSSVDLVPSRREKHIEKKMNKEQLTLGILILTRLGCSRSEVVHFKYKVNKNTTLARGSLFKLKEMRE